MRPLFFWKMFGVAILITCFTSTYAQTIDTASCIADAHVYSGSVGTNYGSDTAIPIYVSGFGYYRYYLKFDLSALSIPSNAIIHSADLILKPNATGEGGAGTGAFVLEQVTASWNENTVAFNAQPSVTTAKQVTVSQNTGGVRTFGIKDIVQGFVNGTATNHGFVVRRANEVTTTAACAYHSREVITVANHPTLIVKWYLPVTFTSVAITHASDSTTADGSITPVIAGGSGDFSYQWYNLNHHARASLSGETSLALSDVSKGCYGLEMVGDWGDSHYMAFIVGVSCGETTVHFYPGPNFTEDAYLTASAPTTPGGASNSIQTNGTGASRALTLLRFLLWFDPSLTAQSADLHLTGRNHINPGTPSNDAEFRLVTSEWAENTVVYNTEPTSSSSIVVDVPPTSSSAMSGDYAINAFCNYWNTHTNYGVVFKLDGAGNVSSRQQYYSSDAADTADHPYIRFHFDHVGCIQTAYTRFKREPDAGYTLTTQNKLKICFTEAHQQVAGKKVPLKLYDQNHNLVAAINGDGSAVSGRPLLPELNYRFDENRHVLDLSSYSLTTGQFYLLELTKSTGEREYIRFMYTN